MNKILLFVILGIALTTSKITVSPIIHLSGFHIHINGEEEEEGEEEEGE